VDRSAICASTGTNRPTRGEEERSDVAIGSLRSVTKSFGDTCVVDAISFDVETHETLVLLGPSGSGKSTILRMIAGLETPDAGEIRLGGVVANDPAPHIPPEKRGISMVFQNLALWPHMTARENLEFGLASRGVPRGERRRRIDEMLALVELPDRGGSYPHELSGGERQRIALARALVLEPKIVCFDEPLSDLDRELKEELVRKMAEIFHRVRITAVYVTHDQEEAMSLASRILVLNHGRTEQIATPVEIYDAPASRFVASFVGMTNLLPGEVSDGGGIETPVGTVDASPKAAPGTKVTVALRPEALRIERVAAQGAVAGTVFEGTFRGNRWVYRVVVGDHAVSAVSPEPVAAGTPAFLRVSGRGVAFVD